MKQRIKISENFQIKEVDAEIVKIGPFYFGLFWNENEYSEHRITAVEVTSGLVAGVVYKKRNKAPKKKLLEELERLVAAGHIEDALSSYVATRKEQVKRLKLKYEIELLNYKYPLNQIEL